MPLLKDNITIFISNHNLDFNYVSHSHNNDIKLECNKCKTRIKLKWATLRRKKENFKCSYCSRKDEITFKFNELKIGNIEKIFIGKSKDNRNRWYINFSCFNGHTNKNIRWENVKRRKTCPKCNYNVTTWKRKQIKELLNKNSLELINDLPIFPNANTLLIVKDRYNYKYRTTPHQLNQNNKNGNKLNPFLQRKFKGYNLKNWIKLNRPDYELTVEEKSLNDVNSKSNIEFKYIGDQLPVDTNPVFHCSLAKFKSGQNHPYFKNNSKGEILVAKILTDLNLTYQPQYPVKIKEQTLRFDFAVFDNDKIIFFIEFNGKQHYNSVKYFGGENALKKQRENDDKKKKYTKDKNIKLLIFTKLNENDIKKHIQNTLANNTYKK